MTFRKSSDKDRGSKRSGDACSGDWPRSRSLALQNRPAFLEYVIAIICVSVLSTIHVSAELDAGSVCQTANGTWGICKAFHECISQRSIRPTRNLVRCGFEGFTEIICCLDDVPDPALTGQTTTPFLFDSQPGIPPTTATPSRPDSSIPIRVSERRSEAECRRFGDQYPGTGLEFQILGGTKTNAKDYPHMAAIGYTDLNNGDISWLCGGALVSENYILTAAHCMTRQLPTVVRLGQVDLDNDPEGSGEDIPVADVILHPNYIPRFNYHDIALIRLSRNATMGEFVYPACLRTSTADVPNESLWVTGWGDTSIEHRVRSRHLLHTNVTAMDLGSCNQTYSEYPNRRLPNVLNMGQMCAYDPRAINDACQGDSGGPLQINMANNVASIVGVTSFGHACGTEIPSVYARVAFYLDWLESVMWPN